MVGAVARCASEITAHPNPTAANKRPAARLPPREKASREAQKMRDALKKLGVTEEQIRHQLEGNLCRCTGYHNIVKAIQWAAEQMAAGKK